MKRKRIGSQMTVEELTQLLGRIEELMRETDGELDLLRGDYSTDRFNIWALLLNVRTWIWNSIYLKEKESS